MMFTERHGSLEIEFEDTDTNKEQEIVFAMFQLTKALVRRGN